MSDATRPIAGSAPLLDGRGRVVGGVGSFGILVSRFRAISGDLGATSVSRRDRAPLSHDYAPGLPVCTENRAYSGEWRRNAGAAGLVAAKAAAGLVAAKAAAGLVAAKATVWRLAIG